MELAAASSCELLDDVLETEGGDLTERWDFGVKDPKLVECPFVCVSVVDPSYRSWVDVASPPEMDRVRSISASSLSSEIVVFLPLVSSPPKKYCSRESLLLFFSVW